MARLGIGIRLCACVNESNSYQFNIYLLLISTCYGVLVVLQLVGVPKLGKLEGPRNYHELQALGSIIPLFECRCLLSCENAEKSSPIMNTSLYSPNTFRL